jgi:uncharacterized protein
MLRDFFGSFLKRVADRAEVVPQRLKPQVIGGVDGTAKAVPISKTVSLRGTDSRSPSWAGTFSQRLFALAAVLVVSLGCLQAETVAKLPAPTGYVNDFAGVLTPETKQQVEAFCTQVDQKAKAQIAVVTVNSIEANDGGETTIEEFAVALEEKWKVGAKGTDRGVLMLLVMNPRRGRIEVGYGLEGILNDAKVGDIGRAMAPSAQANDYNTAVPLGVGKIAQVIADDAGVTLTQAEPIHHYHQEQVGTPVHLSFWQLVIGGGVLLVVLIFLISTGNAGWIFVLLMEMMGGGGGGGGRDRDDRGGGGFGGFGGGGSGGGGASGDF